MNHGGRTKPFTGRPYTFLTRGQDSMTDRFQLVAPFQPAGDQPQAIRRLIDGFRGGPRAADAARRHRLGQDLHDRERHRGDPEADAGARAEQDARGAALRRVQGVLPAQRGRVLRQLLRLLPARGLRRRRATRTSRRIRAINEHIEQMRLSATKALLSRADALIVATVSAIYGLGDPERIPQDAHAS